jgi:hypothetical protein
MFRKANLRVLLVIFGVLLILVILSLVLEKRKGERTFRSELVALDTAKVTGLTITDFKNDHKQVSLSRTGNNWQIRSDGKEYLADRSYVNIILQELNRLKADRVVANSRDRWKEFEVTDSLALQVIVKSKSKTLANLMVGKFSWQPPDNPYDRQGKMTSYVRLSDDNEVYAVNGLLRMNLSPDVNAFRDKTILNINMNDVKKISFRYPADSSFVLEKQAGRWTISGMEADSAKTMAYLHSLEHFTGYDVTDDIPLAGTPVFSLVVESEGALPAGAEVMAYAADTVNRYVVTSSMNPGIQFSDRNGIAGRIFKGRMAFMK